MLVQYQAGQRKTSKRVDAVYFDYQKGFNSVSHSLSSILGLLLDWISPFLTQWVGVNDLTITRNIKGTSGVCSWSFSLYFIHK